LPYFDGRSSTEEVRHFIAAEKGIVLNESVMRKLVDFDILGPTTE
jgi:hypothetical protein